MEPNEKIIKPEQLATPEIKPEKPSTFERPQQLLEIVDTDDHEVSQELEAASKEMPRVAIPKTTKSKIRNSIEKVLEADLKDVYNNLNQNQKQNFRKTGEETAAKIETLLKETKFQITKILDLIKKWLMLIPGVNRFFLEQEAKIKTDEIMKLREDLKKRGEI